MTVNGPINDEYAVKAHIAVNKLKMEWNCDWSIATNILCICTLFHRRGRALYAVSLGQGDIIHSFTSRRT